VITSPCVTVVFFKKKRNFVESLENRIIIVFVIILFVFVLKKRVTGL